MANLFPVVITLCLFGSLAFAMPSNKAAERKLSLISSEDYVCPGEGYYPHPVNCELYYGCANFVPVLNACPGQQLFDLRYSGCNWPELTDCGNRTRPEGYPPTTTPPPVEVSTVKPYPCPGDLADELFPDAEDCTSYNRCVHGASYHYTCATPLLYNEVTKACDYWNNVDCGSRPIPTN